MTPEPTEFPRSIAIAGAWGYIGRRFLDVALARGLTAYAHDPGPVPADLPPGRLVLVPDEAEFYRLDADLFHLAVHPEHRRLGLLLARPGPLLILNEKPMTGPDTPEECARIVEAVDRSPSIVLYDFPELFDPLTARVLAHLSAFREVRLTHFELQRSKDREDPANPRNRKRMVSIQYQESVHCLAFALHVAAAAEGSLKAALDRGVRFEARADPYSPPNPEAYPHPVDGRCRYRGSIGGAEVEGLTDFKAGAPWAKRRVIRGVGDGRPFRIEVSYLEGAKSLRIDGVDQPCDPAASSYEAVLATARRWARDAGRDRTGAGPYPNPRFARAAYQLSAALWRSSRDRAEVRFAGLGDLEAWGPGFDPSLPIPTP